MLRPIIVDDLHDIVEALSTALDAKSVCMCGHSERVAEISRLLAKAMRLSPAEQTRIHIARSYRAALGLPQAVDELRRWSGSQFDPEVVDALLTMIKEYRLPVFRPRPA